MTFFGMPTLNWILFFFLYVPIVIMWVSVIMDAVRRPDISGGAKFGWIILVFALPLIGSLIYLITRPTQPLSQEEMQQRRRAA